MTDPTTTTVVSLPPEDVVELTEILDFLAIWFHDDRDILTGLFRRHTLGFFTLNELTSELERFTTQLGATR